MSTQHPAVLAIAADALICGLLEDVFTTVIGHSVEITDDPSEGVRRAREGDLDLIILDLGWPEAKGLEVCRQLRALPQAASVPIIALTDVPVERDDVSGYTCGPNEYLTKPFHIADLFSAIRRYCPIH
ncbi:MAG TPA: response regulator [Chloroflexota bacterium]|nr:response regulator [Chloroflexota bacterium]